MVSKRMTSAPSCASVSPPSGAATKAEPSTTRIPASSPIEDQTARVRAGLHPPSRPAGSARLGALGEQVGHAGGAAIARELAAGHAPLGDVDVRGPGAQRADGALVARDVRERVVLEV